MSSTAGPSLIYGNRVNQGVECLSLCVLNSSCCPPPPRTDGKEEEKELTISKEFRRGRSGCLLWTTFGGKNTYIRCWYPKGKFGLLNQIRWKKKKLYWWLMTKRNTLIGTSVLFTNSSLVVTEDAEQLLFKWSPDYWWTERKRQLKGKFRLRGEPVLEEKSFVLTTWGTI